MTKEFKTLLCIASAGARGCEPEPGVIKDLDLKKNLKLAQEHSVLELVLLALRKCRNEDTSCVLNREQLFKLRQAISVNSVKKQSMIALIQEMEAAGIPVLLVKGYAVGEYYGYPESRVSTDTDLLISPEDEKKACEFLASKGFSVTQRWSNGHHATTHHEFYGFIEVHVRLYDELIEEIWFGRDMSSGFVMEASLPVYSRDGLYHTLGVTDHLLFLTLHMVKHFILSGISIRMILDIALYISKNINRIDFDRFWSTLCNLKYNQLIQCILWAAVKYCGFAKADFPGLDPSFEDSLKVEQVLADLEAGGFLGNQTKTESKVGWLEYNRQIIMQDKGQFGYIAYMLWFKIKGYLRSLFPGKEQLTEYYPYVLQKAWLIPYAWMHRLVFRGIRRLLSGETTAWIVDDQVQLSGKAKKRVQLFRELGFL